MGLRKRRAGMGAALVALALAPDAALAHAADRGFVLLLPTGYYMLGGACAVALSILIVALVPARPLDRLASSSITLFRGSLDGRIATSALSFGVLGALLWAGVHGSRDPLSNPLPLVFWTLWWVGLTLLSGLFGNLWRWLDPWYTPWRAVRGLLRLDPQEAPLRLPERLGYWPAIALFAGFAWFELIHPAPDDPDRLAVVIGIYWTASLGGMLLFGHRAWTTRVECFSVFFSMVARLSPFERRAAPTGRSTLHLVPPGGKLTRAAALPLSGTLFLLLALSTVSFDGFMRTFTWLAAIGVNPLEFPGRSAVMIENSLGLALTFGALAGAFMTSIWLGTLLAGGRAGAIRSAGLLVWSIVPIALAYHFSHYLVALVINGQYALAALSDPLSNGANLFGTAGFHVQAGAASSMDSAWIIWNLQAAAIIGGHVMAVLIAHLIAWRIHGQARAAFLAGAPLGLLMIAYTVFGLWLLSSPAA